MKIAPLFFVSLFFLMFIYSTRKIWIDPETYIEDNKRKRAEYSYIWSIFPFSHVAKFLNSHTTFELWYSRIVLLLMYLMVGFGLLVSFTDSLR